MRSSKIKPIKKSRTTGWSLDKYIWYLLLLKGGQDAVEKLRTKNCQRSCRVQGENILYFKYTPLVILEKTRTIEIEKS